MVIDSVKQQNKKCTVVVSSCDKCSDLWYPFFSLFQKAWPENEFSIVLNTERRNIMPILTAAAGNTQPDYVALAMVLTYP